MHATRYDPHSHFFIPSSHLVHCCHLKGKVAFGTAANGHLPRFLHISALPHRRQFFCPSLPSTSSALPLYHVSSRDSFLHAIPSVFTIKSSSIPVGVGSLSRSHHPCASSSTFQAHFPSLRVTAHSLRTIQTSTVVKAIAR